MVIAPTQIQFLQHRFPGLAEKLTTDFMITSSNDTDSLDISNSIC